jgi:VTC domain
MATDDWLTQPFLPISLEALNGKAAMLERLDHKYVVRSAVLRDAVADLAAHFDMLEIHGVRSFTYDTCYFDDAERRGYFDHHQGRRQRMKVRVRRYADTGQCFVEVKLKARRGGTVKKRMAYPLQQYGTLDVAALAHVQRSFQAQYGRPFDRTLERVLDMRYRRTTLVARDGGERMTIDSRIRFGDERDPPLGPDDDIFIIETKSAHGHGLADAILRRHHQHPTDGCSKYCVGMVVTGTVQRYNRFRPALSRLGVLPAPAPAGLAGLPARRP